MTSQRPSVTLHFAQSVDGRLGARNERTEISTREGIEHAHRARASHDAVLVGARTVAVDDPQLTVRACEGPQPLRVVLSSTLLAIPERARLFQPSAPPGGQVLVLGAEGRATAAARARLTERGAEVWVIRATHRGHVSLPHALSMLYERGVRRLLVEGGAAVLTSFLLERLADCAEIEIAPQLFGDTALPALGALGDPPLRSAISLHAPTVERLGHSVLLRGELVYPS